MAFCVGRPAQTWRACGSHAHPAGHVDGFVIWRKLSLLSSRLGDIFLEILELA